MRRHYRAIFVVGLICALVSIGAQAHLQKAVSTRSLLPFEPAEELVYEGKLSRAILRNISIAELRFTAGRPLESLPSEAGLGSSTANLRFTADAVSKGLLRKLFGFRFHQRAESTVEPSSFTVLQAMRLDEQGNRQRTSESVYDRKAGKLVWTEVDPNDPGRPPRILTSQFNGALQDVASVLFFVRTQPLTPGKSFEVSITESGRIFRIPVKVVERTRMTTVLGEVPVVRIVPELFGDGRLLTGHGSISIWFTDDARHIPVRAHVSNDLGTLDIKLKSISHGAPARSY